MPAILARRASEGRRAPERPNRFVPRHRAGGAMWVGAGRGVVLNRFVPRHRAGGAMRVGGGRGGTGHKSMWRGATGFASVARVSTSHVLAGRSGDGTSKGDAAPYEAVLSGAPTRRVAPQKLPPHRRWSSGASPATLARRASEGRRAPERPNRFVPRHEAGGAMWVGPGAGSGQSFRSPAQGRGSDVGWSGARVVVNRLAPGTRPGERCGLHGHPDEHLLAAARVESPPNADGWTPTRSS